MESASRNGAVVPPDSGPEVGRVEVVTAAAALRWSRPDLTAALAEHLMEAASALSDRDGWLVAAGWRVHATGATGDAREAAAEVLEALPRWGSDALSASAAERLRLELAVCAHDAGEHGASRTLLEGVSRHGGVTDAALAADVATAGLRCRGVDAPSDPADALAAWGRVGRAAGETGAATVLLVAAATDRRVGRAESAVTRAVEGLGRLDRARTSVRALNPSPHLAAALAAEWISALIAAGRSDQSREGSRLLRERLVEYARPTRQLALLRLTLARVAAEDAPDGDADAAKELERAAHDAAASDAPELEYLCRTALGEVHETGGRLESALESVRLAVAAERRHRSRAVRFRAALAAIPGLRAEDPPTGAAPTQGAGTPGSRIPVRSGPAGVEPSGGAAPTGTVPPPNRPDRAAAGAPAGSAERTAVLRSVQAASMAHPRPGVGSPRRGPVAPEGGRGRDAEQNDPPAGAGRSPSSGSAAPGPTPDRAAASGPHGAAVNGLGETGAGTNAAGPRASRVNGTGVRLHGAAGTEGNGANGHGSRHLGSRTGSGGVDRSRVNGGATNNRAPHESGWVPPGVGPDPGPAAGEADPPVTAPMNPWATGVWTAEAPHAPEKAAVASSAGRADTPTADPEPAPVHAAVPDPVASALADPESWLASALADLDRIWGRGPEGADDPAHDDPDPPGAADAPPAGCVVVLDLTRGGERLSAEEVTSTVRRVARRLARQLPESAHLLRDRPDAVSVVLADGDRVAAAEWMHRVVPNLVDGLAVDAAVEGAHLRAAVHDVQGVVGAQVLQRLDGGRTRSTRGGTPGRARHAAPGDLATDTGTGGATPGPVVRDAEGADDEGPRRAASSGSGTADGRATDGVTSGGGPTGNEPTGSGLTVSAVTDGDDSGAGTTDGVPGGASGRDTSGVGIPGGEGRGRTTPGDTSRDGVSPDTASRDDGTAGGAGRDLSPAASHRHSVIPAGVTPADATPGSVTPGRPTGAAEPHPPTADRSEPADGDTAAGPGRHDEAGGRRPYLPDGVVVRPGTGGRRRSPDPTPDEPESEAAPHAAPAAQQPTEGLGLADLLAGALAAYRGI